MPVESTIREAHTVTQQLTALLATPARCVELLQEMIRVHGQVAIVLPTEQWRAVFQVIDDRCGEANVMNQQFWSGVREGKRQLAERTKAP